MSARVRLKPGGRLSCVALALLRRKRDEAMAGKIKHTDNLPNDARTQLGGLQQANRRANRHKDQHADYSTVDPSLLLQSITKVTASGCAIQFGYTKDGSAFVIRIVGDGDPYNDYVRPNENIDEYLKALAEDFSHSG